MPTFKKPAGSVATPDALTATVTDEVVAPVAVKVTLPVAAGAPVGTETAAVMTDCEMTAGFTVELSDGSRDVHIDGGLTPLHYAYLKPALEDVLAKGTFIKGVLAGMLRKLSWHDFQAAWQQLGQRHAADPNEIEEEWLPELVDRLGFDRVAAQVAEAAAESRRSPPAHPSASPRTAASRSRIRGCPYAASDSGP